MTIWIETPFDNLPQEGFRPQRYWMMAEAFAAAGHYVTYWTADFNHGTKAKRRLVDECAAPSIRIVRIPVPEYRGNVSLARIFSHRAYAKGFAEAALREGVTKRPELVIAAVPTLGAAHEAMRLAVRFGAKFVVDVQDAWPETFYRLLPRGLKPLGRLLFAPLHRTARRLYAEADCVTGVSERYRELTGRKDFRLFRLGIRPPAVASHGRSVSARLTRLVYAGNLGEGYDLATAVEAVATDSSLTLDIAGKGPREAALREEVGRRGLSARVRFHGYLPATELRDLFARCDVGLIPMRDDSWVGLPNKLGDYLAAGLPVLSSLGGECGALLRRERLGATYSWGSAESLLRALGALPQGAVALPDELDATRIYSEYVRACC